MTPGNVVNICIWDIGICKSLSNSLWNVSKNSQYRDRSHKKRPSRCGLLEELQTILKRRSAKHNYWFTNNFHTPHKELSLYEFKKLILISKSHGNKLLNIKCDKIHWNITVNRPTPKCQHEPINNSSYNISQRDHIDCWWHCPIKHPAVINAFSLPPTCPSVSAVRTFGPLGSV